VRVVLDTCILTRVTFPADHNASALSHQLAHAGVIEAWVSSALLEDYADVLADHRSSSLKSSSASPGRFDRKPYQAVSVARPSEFLNTPYEGRLKKRLIRG
jgi:hypothetical protein